jgi:hypothetical protein
MAARTNSPREPQNDLFNPLSSLAQHLAIGKFTCDTAWHELIVRGEPMADAMPDARQEGDSYRRIEVITGRRRRRRWTAKEKALIVAGSIQEGANVRGGPDAMAQRLLKAIRYATTGLTEDLLVRCATADGYKKHRCCNANVDLEAC